VGLSLYNGSINAQTQKTASSFRNAKLLFHIVSATHGQAMHTQVPTFVLPCNESNVDVPGKMFRCTRLQQMMYSALLAAGELKPLRPNSSQSHTIATSATWLCRGYMPFSFAARANCIFRPLRWWEVDEKRVRKLICY